MQRLVALIADFKTASDRWREASERADVTGYRSADSHLNDAKIDLDGAYGELRQHEKRHGCGTKAN